MQLRSDENNKVAAQTATPATLQKVERVYKSDYILVIKNTTSVIPENCLPTPGVETEIIPASTFWQRKREAYQQSGGISFIGNPPTTMGSHPGIASSTCEFRQLPSMVPQNMQQNPLNRFGVFGARSFRYATNSPIPSIPNSTMSGEVQTAHISSNRRHKKKRVFTKEFLRNQLQIKKAKKMLTPGDESTENSPTLLTFSPSNNEQIPETFSSPTLTNDDLAEMLLGTSSASVEASVEQSTNEFYATTSEAENTEASANLEFLENTETFESSFRKI